MSTTGKSATRLVGTLAALAGLLWLIHASAWDLGGRSPVLNYDGAQYALAARELADHGRLATTFALPTGTGRRKSVSNRPVTAGSRMSQFSDPRASSRATVNTPPCASPGAPW